MTLVKNQPEKKYRLRDGTLGTAYDAIVQGIVVWEHRRQEAEDKLEEFRRRLEVAEGHPCVG